MGLHHFLWSDKERTVAVHKLKDKITLTFLDEEIIGHGLEKFSFQEGQSLDALLQGHDSTSQQRIRELLTTVQSQIGIAPFS